jgi:hypothetical protein
MTPIERLKKIIRSRLWHQEEISVRAEDLKAVLDTIDHHQLGEEVDARYSKSEIPR